MQSVTASFPAPAGMTTLRLEFNHPDGTSVIAFNLAVEGIPLPAPPTARASGGALTTLDGPDTLQVGNDVQRIVFDKHTGTIQSWRVNGRDILLGGPILNLGEAKAGSERGMYRAKQPPVTTEAHVAAAPGTGGAVHVAVTSTVLAAAGGSTLGTLVSTYDLTPGAEMTVAWTLNWTAPDIGLWEEGVKFSVPTDMTRMAWQRDAYFTDYPAGHLGEPSGTARAGDLLFRSSKRGLHWLTLTDGRGAASRCCRPMLLSWAVLTRPRPARCCSPAGKSQARTASAGHGWTTTRSTRSMESPSPVPSSSAPSVPEMQKRPPCWAAFECGYIKISVHPSAGGRWPGRGRGATCEYVGPA